MTRHFTRSRLRGAAIIAAGAVVIASAAIAISKDPGAPSPLNILAQQGAGKPASVAPGPGATSRPVGAASRPFPTTTQPSRLSSPAGKPAAQARTGAAANVDAQAVRMSRPGTFEIHVQGADLRGVLQLLSTQGRKNIVATREVTGTVTADLYGVNFKDALEAVLKAAGFVYREKDNFIYVYTPKQLEAELKSERKLSTRTFRLAYIRATDAKALITPALSKDAVVTATPDASVGIAKSNSEAGGNSLAGNDALIVQDYEDNLKEVEKIIAELDVKPDQVLLEVTMLDAKLTENNALGINFSTLEGIDFETLGSASTALGNMSNAGLSGTSLDNAPASTIRTDFPTTSGGMTIGVVSNNVAAFITALEDITDVTVLANPKLLIVNKQRGEVLIGTHQGYLTNTTTEGQVTQSVEFMDTGTRLIVRPFIGRDGFIRLEIHPEDSTGTVQTLEQNVVPSSVSTEMTSNVIVRDGHTIIIGGLFREETTNLRKQIPVLGNIPYVGAAFRYIKDTTVRKEIVILLTPHIIQHTHDEGVSEQVKDDVERFRVGQRKGVQWFGRDRLAQTHMSWARQAMSEGKTDKALWNVDMALSLEPRMEEAIRLRERITGQAFWSDYAQDTSAHFVIQRMMMQDLHRPVERMIPPAKPRDAANIEPVVREAFGVTPRFEDPLMPFGTATQPARQEIMLRSPQTASEKPAQPATQPTGDRKGK